MELRFIADTFDIKIFDFKSRNSLNFSSGSRPQVKPETIYYLERDEGVGGPIGIEDEGDACCGGDTGEEGVRTAGDIFLLHGDILVDALEEHIVVTVVHRDTQTEIARCAVQEGVEVELLLS